MTLLQFYLLKTRNNPFSPILTKESGAFFIMDITIQRPPRTDSKITISSLFVDFEYFSDCAEDADRGLWYLQSIDQIIATKIKHATAIPYGKYQVVMSYSNKFKKYLPELLSVPGFSGIRIHPGNDESDTSGCPLPGTRSGNRVINSRVASDKLIKLIESALKKEKVFLEVLPAPDLKKTL